MLSLLVAMVVILVLAVNKYSGKMRKHYSSNSQLSSDLFCHSELTGSDHRDFTPSCPPAACSGRVCSHLAGSFPLDTKTFLGLATVAVMLRKSLAWLLVTALLVTGSVDYVGS